MAEAGAATDEEMAVGASTRLGQRVIVGVHADDASIPALQWAARSAKARGWALEALMAWDLPVPPRHMPEDVRLASQGVLGDLRWALESIVDRSGISADSSLKVSTTVLAAPAKLALSRAAERAGLLVLGAPQHAAAFAAFSAGRRIATTAPCPVAIVPSATAEFDATRSGDRLVVGMDGSDQSVVALGWSCAEALHRGLPVSVVAVGLHGSAAARVTQAIEAQQQASPSAVVTLKTFMGDPGEVLLQESRGAEALVVGQHGSGWVTQRLPSLGSVSRWCAVHQVCPTVVVPG